MTEQELYDICDNLDKMDYQSDYIPTVHDLLNNGVNTKFEEYKEYLLFLTEKLAEKGNAKTQKERELNIFLNDLFTRKLTSDEENKK
jgi:hypothetical protein